MLTYQDCITKLLWLILFIFLYHLMGCATTQNKLSSTEFQQNQQLIEPISSWRFTGKIGIKSLKESGSANINWFQQNTGYTIKLHGPLGQSLLSLTGNQHEVTLTEKSETTIAKSVNDLIKKKTGWHLPVEELQYWIRGLPAPSFKIRAITLNDLGLMEQLTQSGWSIHYQNYQKMMYQNHLVYMPKKIIAQRKSVQLTLVIRSWIF